MFLNPPKLSECFGEAGALKIKYQCFPKGWTAWYYFEIGTIELILKGIPRLRDGDESSSMWKWEK